MQSNLYIYNYIYNILYNIYYNNIYNIIIYNYGITKYIYIVKIKISENQC